MFMFVNIQAHALQSWIVKFEIRLFFPDKSLF